MIGEPVLIDAPEVLAVGIEECGEALVALAETGLVTAADHPRVTSRDAMRFHCRVAVAEKLVRVEASLPSTLRLCVAECYRPNRCSRGRLRRQVTRARPRTVGP